MDGVGTLCALHTIYNQLFIPKDILALIGLVKMIFKELAKCIYSNYSFYLFYEKGRLYSL